MHWLGHLWAWFNDPIWMIERRDLRRALPGPAVQHVTSMAAGRETDQWIMNCSCGWYRIAYKEHAQLPQVRAILDRHEDRARAFSRRRR